MAVDDAHVFPGFLTPVLTQLFFPKTPNTSLACFCGDERRQYTELKFASQPQGHESDTLTTYPPGRGNGGMCENEKPKAARKSIGKQVVK